MYFDSHRLHQQGHEGAGGRSCAGHGRKQETVDHSADSKKLGQRLASHRGRAGPGSARSVEERQVKRGMREQGRCKTGPASLLHVKLERTRAPGPAGEREEHLVQWSPSLVRGDKCAEFLTYAR